MSQGIFKFIFSIFKLRILFSSTKSVTEAAESKLLTLLKTSHSKLWVILNPTDVAGCLVEPIS